MNVLSVIPRYYYVVPCRELALGIDSVNGRLTPCGLRVRPCAACPAVCTPVRAFTGTSTHTSTHARSYVSTPPPARMREGTSPPPRTIFLHFSIALFIGSCILWGVRGAERTEKARESRKGLSRNEEEGKERGKGRPTGRPV